jgi:hypothetical protein
LRAQVDVAPAQADQLALAKPVVAAAKIRIRSTGPSASGLAVQVDFHGPPGGVLRDAVLRRVHFFGHPPHAAAGRARG